MVFDAEASKTSKGGVPGFYRPDLPGIVGTEDLAIKTGVVSLKRLEYIL